MELLSLQERHSIMDRCQEHWYSFIAQQIAGQSVVDVGAGTGYGVEILQNAGCEAYGIDLLPAAANVEYMGIENLNGQSFDWVVCCDVIEHVDADIAFFNEMLRVARKGVFITTPNFNVWHAHNRFHCREYTPLEFRGRFQLSRWKHSFWCWDHERKAIHDIPVVMADNICPNYAVKIHVDQPVERPLPPPMQKPEPESTEAPPEGGA